ncbi:hypothetical protein N4G58_06030 [Edwardsiella piscicida]|nr:hypothetical protein N4G58_06030 [Edwardsiella piscicida]
MSKAVLWLGVGLMALYVGGAAAEPNTSVAIDAPQPVIASHAAASPSAAPAAPSGAAQAQIKVPPPACAMRRRCSWHFIMRSTGAVISKIACRRCIAPR